MKRRNLVPFLVWLAALGVGRVACAQVVLVTEQEAAAARAAPAPLFTPKAAPEVGAPKILLQMPDISHPVSSPLRINLHFLATAPAVIVPDSFRVLYGLLKLDITNRVTGSARVTPEGLDVSQAILPPGEHSILLELQDSLGRQARQRFKFVIE